MIIDDLLNLINTSYESLLVILQLVLGDKFFINLLISSENEIVFLFEYSIIENHQLSNSHFFVDVFTFYFLNRLYFFPAEANESSQNPVQARHVLLY